MKILSYFLVAAVSACLLCFLSFPTFAGDSCGISQEDDVASTPPLCRGRSLNSGTQLPAAVLTDSAGSQPDFSNVDDILYGDRNLGEVDDILFMNPSAMFNASQPKQTIVRYDYLLTDNEQISEFISNNPLNRNCATNELTDPTTGKTVYSQPSPQQTRGAAMFAVDWDMVVTALPNPDISSNNCERSANNPNNLFILTEDPMGQFPRTIAQTQTTAGLEWLQSAVADFDKDGYEDFLVMQGSSDVNNSGDGQTSIFIFTAKDPEDPEQGLMLASTTEISFDQSATPMGPPVVGDFNGDNILDIAWVGSDLQQNSQYRIKFASICPLETIPTFSGVCDGKEAFTVIVNPLSSEDLLLNSFIDFDGLDSFPASALSAGNFNTNTLQSAGDDLFVAAGKTLSPGTTLYGDSAFFDPASAQEQAVLGIAQTPIHGINLAYYTFDQFMTPTLRKGKNNVYLSDGWDPGCFLSVATFSDNDFRVNTSRITTDCSDTTAFNGIAVGNFTGQFPQTLDDSVSQIATLVSRDKDKGGLSGFDMKLFIWESSPDVNNFRPKRVSTLDRKDPNTQSYFHSLNTNPNPNRQGSFIRTVDLQGRSARLGTPQVARISNWLEVNAIIGAPPMHTAYVQGFNQQGPFVNNFSVIPPTFNTGYTTGTSSSTSSSTQDSTSWSFSFKQSLSVRAKWDKVPLVGGVDANLAASANQVYDCDVSEVNSSYQSTENLISAVTGFGDNIIYTESRKNIYFYPVLGEKVCPDGSQDCPENEKEPLYYQISAPDQVCSNLVDGRTAEFYQPVHQSGNMFTYPASRNQLLQRFSSDGENVLSEPTVGFLTNNSIFNQIKRWNQGQGDECTTGSTETISGEQSISLAMGSSDLAFFLGAGKKVTVGFEFGQSRAINTNQSSTTTTSDSIGIEVNKPDEFLNPDEYKYLVNSYILGQPFPDGEWQSSFSTGPAENISNTGPLIAAFTGNMLANDAGSFWKSGGINPYIQFPDIGLNFPERWRVVPVRAGTIAQQPSYCRLDQFHSGDLACTLIKEPAANENLLWVNGFYHMRGLFIQSGEEPIGPSQTYVYIGDDINLSTRVYNLSLKALEPSGSVRVAFYRQEWDNTLNVPKGDSILISEKTVNTIPPFTSSNTPNWRLVTTTFNTQEKNMGPDRYWVFWVLVYAVDNNGNLIPELPGYGLDSSKFTPGDVFKSILDVPLQNGHS